MRYLFRGLIRETGKTVEGAVEAETPEDALNALSSNGIVTEDLTPAPVPIDSYAPSRRAAYAPATAGGAGPPPLPPGAAQNGANGHGPHSDFVPAKRIEHPDSRSSDPLDRAFAAASQAVDFDAVAQRYRGKSVWVIDRDKIRRQVAGVVDEALKKAEKNDDTGDRVRESVAAALKQLFNDTRNIASQQTPEQVQATQRAQQGQAAPQPQAAAPSGGGQAAMAVSTPQLEALTGRLEGFLAKAETVLTQLQVAARRVGSGGGGGGGGVGFGPRRMSHIPRPQSDAQNSVLSEIFNSNIKLRKNLAGAQAAGETPATREGGDGDAASAPAEEPVGAAA